MACNLSDPEIAATYNRILSGDGVDWMVIGYGSTRDRLSLYASGDGGVTEMALKVPEEVVFCFIVFEGSRVLVTHKEIAEFFNHHDVTVNTTKPSELTPTMLRDKTRHLAIKKIAGSLGRSDTMQQNKLKNSVWHQRSQGSSRASSPSDTSFGGETKDQQKEMPEITTKVEVEAPTPDTQTENTQHPPPASDVDNSASAEAAPRNLDPAALDNAADEADVTRVRHSHAKPVETVPAPEPPMQAPPTPRSFSDTHAEQMPVSEGARDMARSPTKSEFQQTDSPVIVNFEGSEISPSLVENYVQMDSPTVVTEDKRASTVGSPQTSASPTATAVSSSPQRHASLRERQKSTNRSNRASLYSTVLSPSQPEVAVMLDQVQAHRKDVMELANSSGIMGEKYFECVRGYTSIQEPAKAFWKRRFFAIADKTMFMYTNECSRTPSDYLPIDSAVSPPRDAEDEVLMPHSVAVDFGDGEYYLYFDTADMRQAFESEVQKAIRAA
ncbi:hypothetical protein LPJ79_001803 [Coemansia sp. RSA 1821]|nr:hypothetical protein LPJ79_001803 [Coemansia sp. RSA 1821]